MTPAERATKERQAQGLPAHVEDDRVLDRVAALLLADDERAGGGSLVAGTTRRRVNRTSPTRTRAVDADGQC
jgi:hypothetical protein